MPVAASHSRAVLSAEAVTTRAPSGEKAALRTTSSWPRRTAICLPVAASHSRAVLSAEAVTTRVPSGEKAALSDLPVMAAQDGDLPCRWRRPTPARSCPHEAVTTRAPSGEKAALRTASSWPRRTATCLAGGGVPQPRGLVQRGGDDARAVRREGGAANLTVMAAQDGDLPCPWRRPTAARSCPHEAVTTRVPSGEKAALTTASSWPRRTATCLARRGVPHPRGLVR